MTKQDTRKLPRVAVEAIRIRVIRAVVNEGVSQKEAARLFGITPTSVCRWMKAYHAKGEKALRNKPLGRPKGQKLTEVQAAGIRKSVIGRHPDQLRLPGFLWTRELVGAMIERRHGITLSRWTVGRYMKAWGLTVQKPMYAFLPCLFGADGQVTLITRTEGIPGIGCEAGGLRKRHIGRVAIDDIAGP